MPTATIYRGGRVHSPGSPDATALLVTGGEVAWLGADADAPAADRTVDLDGALVTPAFVDAHVHATDTGLALRGLDLAATRSAAQLLDAVAAAARQLPGDAVVLGHGWDDSTWADPTPPDAAALDRAAGGRPVYATQASMHSALCSSPLLAAAEGAAGYDPAGWLRRDANHGARRAAFASVSAAQRTAAQRAALQRAASLGIAAVHECGGSGISSEADFTGLLGLSGDHAPEVYGYWGELGAAAKAKELGAAGAGGDLFADGALGARTAHLREPYRDYQGDAAGSGGDAGGGAPCGYGYLTREQVRDHLLDCHRVGVSGGFHAIGDQALATVLAGFAAAAATVGIERLRAARHRIEHVELVDRAMIAALVEHGVVASVQPAFDRLWGGPKQMYTRRLGVDRALAANPFGAMHAVGVALAFGSDSPVTPLDPWGSVRAAIWHHLPVQRVTPRTAFAAHTRGGWRAVHQDGHGVLTIGAPATFAVWHTPAGRDDTVPGGAPGRADTLPGRTPGRADTLPSAPLPVLLAADPQARGPHDPTPLPVCRRTVLRGTTIYDTDAP